VPSSSRVGHVGSRATEALGLGVQSRSTLSVVSAKFLPATAAQ
jgi:hypothetical protein